MVPKVGDAEARFWDICIKIGGGAIAIGTLIIGFNTLTGLLQLAAFCFRTIKS